MIFLVITCVIQILVFFLVLVDVFRLNLQQKAVCVRVQELTPWAVVFLELVVVKIIHEDLAHIKYRHPDVDRLVKNQLAFVHVNSDQADKNHKTPYV